MNTQFTKQSDKDNLTLLGLPKNTNPRDPRDKGLSQTNLSNVGKYLGYAPGIWYDQTDSEGKPTFNPDAQRRFGNLVTGAGLGTAGVLSVPILQWLFPDRFAKFKGQGKRLALAAMIGGMALPFAATLPAEVRALNNWWWDKPNAPTDKVKDAGVNNGLQTNYTKYKKANINQFSPDFPLMKSHLAAGILDEVRAGTLSPASATRFMQGVGQQTPPNQPWFTVGDVGRAALGAGAGAAVGGTVGKGVSFFLGLTPKGRRNIRNVGMGLGALINTGKIGL